MNESDTPASAQTPQPKKSDRKVVLIAIAMGLGLLALIALNMN